MTEISQFEWVQRLNFFLFSLSVSTSSPPSLLNLCSLKNQDHLLKLTVSSLDYSRDGLARVILSKILTAATDVSLILLMCQHYLPLDVYFVIQGV